MTYFDIYKVLFTVELLVAEFLFTFRLKKRKYFSIRFTFSCLALIGLSFAFPSSINAAWYSCVVFFALFAVSLFLLFFCYKEKFENIFFCGLASYTTQHFAYEIANILLSAILLARSPILGMYGDEKITLAFNDETFFIVLVYLLCYFTSYWVMFLCFARQVKKGQDLHIKSRSLLLLLGVGLLVNIVLNSIVVYYDFEFVSNLIHYAANILCCVLLLYAQFTLIHNEELQNRINVIQQLWAKEKKQYEISKDNIDIINRKCHDMRYQIREIGKHNNISSDVVTEIEKSIKLYDMTIKTGNEPLDIILTEKNLTCSEEHISLTCVADGKLLSFIEEADLYSLFGNAIDNAIEAVKKIKDFDERLISLKIKEIGEIISVSISNTYSGEIKFDEQGFPLTSKGDTDYHGFGVRSIQYVVDKYHGDLSIMTKNNLFYLNIIIPKPAVKQC